MITIRFKQTGAIQEFIDDFAMHLIAAGQAERIDKAAVPIVETATVIPQTEKAAFTRPLFIRGPRRKRRATQML